MNKDTYKDKNESTHINVAVSVVSHEPFKRRLNVFYGYVSNFTGLGDEDKLPAAVTDIHQKEAVAAGDIRLSLYRCGEIVEEGDEIEIDGFVGHVAGKRAVVFVVHVLFVSFTLWVVFQD